MPAERCASPAASTSRSSALLSQCSAKGVQPMPTIATLSLMPLLAMPVSLPARWLAPRPRLPEVIVHPPAGVEPPEGHLELVPDRHPGRLHVRELADEAPAALEIQDRVDDRRLERVGE